VTKTPRPRKINPSGTEKLQLMRENSRLVLPIISRHPPLNSPRTLRPSRRYPASIHAIPAPKSDGSVFRGMNDHGRTDRASRVGVSAVSRHFSTRTSSCHLFNEDLAKHLNACAWGCSATSRPSQTGKIIKQKMNTSKNTNTDSIKPLSDDEIGFAQNAEPLAPARS